MESGKKADRPCPVCGDESYAWGTLGEEDINITPKDRSLVSKFFRVGVKFMARRCNGCGNVQLFADPPESDA